MERGRDFEAEKGDSDAMTDKVENVAVADEARLARRVLFKMDTRCVDELILVSPPFVVSELSPLFL